MRPLLVSSPRLAAVDTQGVNVAIRRRAALPAGFAIPYLLWGSHAQTRYMDGDSFADGGQRMAACRCHDCRASRRCTARVGAFDGGRYLRVGAAADHSGTPQVKRPAGRSIAFPLIGLIAIVSVITAAAGYLQAARSQQASLALQTERSVRHVGAVVEMLIRAEVPHLRTLARSLSANSDLTQAIDAARKAGNPVALAAVMDEFYKASKVDLFQVSDRDERVLYRAHDPAHHGDIPDIWGVTEALAGDHLVATSKGPSGLALRAISPLRAGGRTVGTVMVGSNFDDKFASRLAGQAGADIHFASPRGVWAGSRPSTESVAGFQESLEQSLRIKQPVFFDDAADRKARLFVPFGLIDETFVLVVEADTTQAHARALPKRCGNSCSSHWPCSRSRCCWASC